MYKSWRCCSAGEASISDGRRHAVHRRCGPGRAGLVTVTVDAGPAALRRRSGPVRALRGRRRLPGAVAASLRQRARPDGVDATRLPAQHARSAGAAAAGDEDGAAGRVERRARSVGRRRRQSAAVCGDGSRRCVQNHRDHHRRTL